MEPLVQKTVYTPYGEKSISVYARDILELHERIDVMAVSAFYHDYYPLKDTVLGALDTAGISVEALSHSPEIDLRKQCHIWLSRPVENAGLPIERIGCIELMPYSMDQSAEEDCEGRIISSIQAYFHMLHIASLSGINMEKIALPLLGTGHIRIDPALITIPIINECFRFLKTNEKVKEIHIVSKDHSKAFQFALAMERSYSACQETRAPGRTDFTFGENPSVFISYSSRDRKIADFLCGKLEQKGIRVWYAPRDIHYQDYASAIVDAIIHCTHFIVIISEHSLQSHHVLNEIDLAFKELNRHIHIIPLKIDDKDMGPAFCYYLSRQQWTDASHPPVEEHLETFAASFSENSAT